MTTAPSCTTLPMPSQKMAEPPLNPKIEALAEIHWARGRAFHQQICGMLMCSIAIMVSPKWSNIAWSTMSVEIYIYYACTCCEFIPCLVAAEPLASWSSWGALSSCSRTCNGGTQTRRRSCVGGASCPGTNIQTVNCNTQSCPGRLSCDANHVGSGGDGGLFLSLSLQSLPVGPSGPNGVVAQCHVVVGVDPEPGSARMGIRALDLVHSIVAAILKHAPVCLVCVCVCLHACVRMCSCLRVRVHVCVRACMHIIIHACVRVCIRACVCLVYMCLVCTCQCAHLPDVNPMSYVQFSFLPRLQFLMEYGTPGQHGLSAQ